MADDKQKSTYPTIPESNWWNIRSKFNKTLPANVSNSYLKSLLGLNADQAARNIASALRTLSLINADGTPTELANQWRTDSTYSDACDTMLLAIYPQELLDLFPDKDFDRVKAKEWFKTTGKLGESSAQKVVALFAILKSGELNNVTTTIRSSAKQSKTQKISLKKLPSSQPIVIPASVDSPNEMMEKTTNEAPKANPHMTMHIDLQIHISPDASAEQIDMIFASMAKHIFKQ